MHCKACFLLGRFNEATVWVRQANSQSEAPQMITEIAQIDVKPGTEKDFEAAVAKAKPLFLRARGGKGFELHNRSRSRRATG
jgi:Antibiotic biosynthesis monooxygenase